jgi:hypothetical protein
MRPGKQYRMRTATLGLACLANPRLISTIPKGAIVTVVGPFPDDDRMICVYWEQKTIAVFVVDLRDRSVAVGKSKAGSELATRGPDQKMRFLDKFLNSTRATGNGVDGNQLLP